MPALGAYGPVNNPKTMLYYLTSAGRPLAMASFLIDANDWPADPEPFKRTNLLIHLLNGVLLCTLLLQLGRMTRRDPASIEWSAALGMGLWLLHPLWASTVLYIVQREAMLSTSFVLLGLLAYLHGRSRMAKSPRAGIAWIVGGVGLCTLLSLLCKANGALLPLLVTVMEWIFIRQQSGATPPPRALSRSLTFAIYPAAGLVVAYLVYAGVQGFAHGMPSFRPWTLGQRLLTEPRVLLDYLRLLIVPRPFSSGLFNDAYAPSQDWLHPWTTLPSLLAIASLVATAVAIRRRWPAVALGIVFYLAGHAMESSTLALELYFEHRNYLPSIFLFWALALWLCDGAHWRPFKTTIAVVALAMLATETWAAASIWGNTLDQARIWALK
ncbi:MAG: tetratricopeptide repeat protein, partial [Gammaproteobacteria bacterium]